jgi:prepilin-type N-terminal cleavage/methylation domain-containing protein/prepilin-type processing-associated H-X9-DG protein
MKSESENGFTLIEILVVIAIIAVLAAILFPVFATVREKARQVACASNEKQLGLGLLQYAQDYDEYLPCGSTGVGLSGDGRGIGWAGQMYPYLKSSQVYVCPDDSLPVNFSWVIPFSYMENENIIRQISWGNAWNSYSMNGLSQFTAPSSTVMLAEAHGGMLNPALVNSSSVDVYSSMANGWDQPSWNQGTYLTGLLGGRAFNSNAMQTPQAIHNAQGANFLAADGHVKFLNGSRVSGGFTPEYPNTPQGIDSHSSQATAASTDNMTDGHGHTFALTFSTL